MVEKIWYWQHKNDTNWSIAYVEIVLWMSWIFARSLNSVSKLRHCIQIQDLLRWPVILDNFFSSLILQVGHYFSMNILIPHSIMSTISLTYLSLYLYFLIHGTVWFYLPWKARMAIHSWHQCMPHCQGDRDFNVKHLNFQASFKASCIFTDCMHVIVIQFFRQCHSICTNFILRTSFIFVSIEPLP